MDTLTVKEVAETLGITPRAVRLWIETGRIHAHRVRGAYGMEWRIPADELTRMRRRAQPPAASTPLEHAPATDLLSQLSAQLSALNAMLTTLTQHLDALEQLSSRQEDRLQRLEELLHASAPPRSVWWSRIFGKGPDSSSR